MFFLRFYYAVADHFPDLYLQLTALLLREASLVQRWTTFLHIAQPQPHVMLFMIEQCYKECLSLFTTIAANQQKLGS
jgi:hypothetical protein